MDETGNSGEAQPMEVKVTEATPAADTDSSSKESANDQIPATHNSSIAPGSAAPVVDSSERSQAMEGKQDSQPTPEAESSSKDSSSVSVTAPFTPTSTQDNSMAPGFAAPTSSEPVTTTCSTNDALPMDTTKSIENQPPATTENDSSKDSSNTPNSTPPLSQEPVNIATGQPTSAPGASSNSSFEPPQPMEAKGDEVTPVDNDSSKDSMIIRGESVASQEVTTPLPTASTPASAPLASLITSVPTTNGSNKKPRIDYASLPTRQYLDQTVVPILLHGLQSLAKTRPEDPMKYLANYLLEHRQEYEDR